MKVDLLEFLRTGRFGTIAIGDPEHSVQEKLGPPCDVGGTSPKRGRPSVFKYGDIQIGFELDPPHSVHFISISRSDPCTHPSIQFPPASSIETGGLEIGMKLNILRSILQTSGIAYSEQTEFDEAVLRSEGGIAVYTSKCQETGTVKADKWITEEVKSD